MYVHLLEKRASALRCPSQTKNLRQVQTQRWDFRQIFTQACRFVKKFPSHGAGDGKGLMISD